MDQEHFSSLIQRQVDKSFKILNQKGDRYAPGGNKLHNFETAAILEGTTPSKALAGMMAKHTVKLYDMLGAPQVVMFTPEDWEEVVTDHINYLLILVTILADEFSRMAMPEEIAMSDMINANNIRPDAKISWTANAFDTK